MNLKKYRIALVGGLLFIQALFTSCVTVNKIADAQDYFNKAAEAENSTKFSGSASGAELVQINNIRTNYALAYKFVNDALSTDKSGLASDKLLGTAYSIKAICEWKLADFTNAVNSSKLALDSLKSETNAPGRDMAVMTALPGLIKIDQAYAKIMAGTSSYSDLVKLLDSAMDDLENASGVVDKKHPVQVYLAMSKLTALRNMQVGIEKLLKSGSSEERASARNNLRPIIKKELNTLSSLLGNDAQLVYWKNLFGEV